MTQLVPSSPAPPSPGAERMRRHRERRRKGKVCVMIELDPRMISGLTERGWLPASQRDDQVAVVHAFCRFVGYALDVTRNTRR